MDAVIVPTVGEDEPTAEETPENQPPEVFGPGNVSVQEGPLTVDQLGVFLDMDSTGPFAYRIDWGDGSVPANGTATIDVAGPPTFGSFAGTHGYADDGSFELSMSVTDEQGATGTEVFEISVVNVPPQFENVTITSPISEGATATVRGTIVDPGVNDTFVLVITWGDGATDTFNYPAGTTSFRATHRYVDNRPGNEPYPVRLAVTDDDEPDKPAIADLLVVVQNLPPTAVDDIYAHTGDGPLVVDAALGVLVNDTDPGNDALTAVEYGPPTAGTLEGRPDGSFTYTPPRANFSGIVRFTYKAMDSEGAISESAASVTVDSSLRASISGTVRAILPGAVESPLAVGIPGVTITLTEVTTQDIVKTTTLSGDDGSYRFDGLRVGTYVVTETQPAALFPFGTDSYTVVLNGNDARTGVDFQEGWIRNQVISLRNFFASGPGGLAAYTPDALRHLVAQAEAQAGRLEQAAAIRQGGSQTTVIIEPGAGNDTVDFVAGSAHHRVTVNGRPLIFVTSAMEGFRIRGGEGQDTLRLVGSPSDDVATLRPVSELSTLQLPNYALTSGPYLVGAQGWEIITAEGGGGYDRAVLHDSPGDDLTSTWSARWPRPAAWIPSRSTARSITCWRPKAPGSTREPRRTWEGETHMGGRGDFGRARLLPSRREGEAPAEPPGGRGDFGRARRFREGEAPAEPRSNFESQMRLGRSLALPCAPRPPPSVLRPPSSALRPPSSLRLADAIEARGRANQQPVTGQRRGGHAHVILRQRIGVQDFELITGAEHGRDAVFVEAEDFAAVGPG